VAYAYAGAPESPDLLIVEMDSVRDPGAGARLCCRRMIYRRRQRTW
jgi:hypothetical protein